MGFLYILLALAIFGLLIFIHELGHFIVARLCGVKILEFALGMGPRILWKTSKKSGTVYSLRAFPLGGFVSMMGEQGMEAVQGKNTPDDGKFFLNGDDGEEEASAPQMSEEDAKHAYCNQSVWKRILISLAGPMMNILLGFVLMLVLVLSSGRSALGGTQVAGFFVEYYAQESELGFETGDLFHEIDGKQVMSYAGLRDYVAQDEDGIFSVTVLRPNEDGTDAEVVTIENIALGVDFLDAHFQSSLSEASGLCRGDEILKVNGTRVHTYNELAYEIMNQGYEPMELTVLRGDEKVVLKNVQVPSYVEQGVTFGNLDFRIWVEEDYGVGTVLKHTWYRSLSTVKMVFDSLGGLFSGRYGVEAVSGPVGITKTISDVAKTSMLGVLNLVVIISINLGVMNLLPIPALDGGHLLIYFIEVIRRKPVKPEVEGMINFIGLVLMLGLLILISIKDIIAL